VTKNITNTPQVLARVGLVLLLSDETLCSISQTYVAVLIIELHFSAASLSLIIKEERMIVDPFGAVKNHCIVLLSCLIHHTSR
jgi:hypothetical protein